MPVTHRSLAVAAGLLFLGCVAAPQPDSLLVEAANAPIRCSESKDCEVKWARAFDWVRHHSSWQITAASPELIQADGPAESCFRSAARLPRFAHELTASRRYSLRRIRLTRVRRVAGRYASSPSRSTRICKRFADSCRKRRRGQRPP